MTDSEASGDPSRQQPARVGRYLLFDALASGGMARVHLAKLVGEAGFSRVVAVKRLHPHLAEEPDFVSMFLDEARLAARVRHPNVVPILDVVSTTTELFLVLEYVHGESLAGLLRASNERGEPVRPDIAAFILAGVLAGLHAAHEAVSESGATLGIVHRDVSPQNVILGADGLPRVLDFGIAYASERLQSTRTGQIKGKLRYMSPEQLEGGDVDRRTDVYAAGVVLWELLTGQRLFEAAGEGAMHKRIAAGATTPPSAIARHLMPSVDAVVMKSLAVRPEDRHGSARELALELERVLPLASQREVADWVRDHAGAALARRAAAVARIESGETEAATTVRVSQARDADATDVATSHTAPRPSAPPPRREVTETTATTLASRDSAPRSRRALPLAILAVVGVLLAALLLVGLSAREPKPPEPELAVISLPQPSPTQVAATASSEPTAESTPTMTQAPPTEPPPSATTAAPRKPPKVARDPCNPPFTVDKDGVRVPKPACF